jgi:hypothetical protein
LFCHDLRYLALHVLRFWLQHVLPSWEVHSSMTVPLRNGVRFFCLVMASHVG